MREAELDMLYARYPIGGTLLTNYSIFRVWWTVIDREANVLIEGNVLNARVG